jgi:toxin ParE1/3/4
VTRPVVLRDQAELELGEAVLWYEARRAGLGLELLDEVHRGLEAIEEGFDGSPHLDAGPLGITRRVFPERFPYAVIFVVAGETVEVLAFAHLRRRPGYWRGR